MIVIIVDASGSVKYQSTTAIHQGSVDANKVMLVGPFPTAVITVAATLPNGKVYGYDLLKAKDEEKAEYALTSLGNLGGAYLDGSELFAYSYTLKGALTAKAGTLKLQFFINTSHFVEGGTESETFATNNVTVDVINGSGWLPSEPVVPDSIYTEIIKEFGALTTAVEGAKSASEDAKNESIKASNEAKASADNAWNHANIAYNIASTVDVRERKNFSNLNDRLEIVETFFDGAADDTLGEALNTLKEIQDYIGDHGEEASKLIEQVNTNKEDIAHLEGNVESMMRDLSDANERLEKVEETLEEGVGGVSSWNDLTDKPDFAKVATSGSYNDLTDKPFGSETTEGIITFDGDYSKHVYFDMGNSMYVHVSDKVLTVNEARGATIRVVALDTGEFEDFIPDDGHIQPMEELGAQVGADIHGCAITLVSSIINGAQGIMSVGGDINALQAAGLPIPKEGTYFEFKRSDFNSYYVESISCLTGLIETIKQIDKKYLPDTSVWNLVITAEMLKESSLNELLAGANGRVFVKAIDDSTTINVPSAVKLIEFAPSVIFGSVVEIIGHDDIDTYYLDDCQVIKGATVRVTQSDTSYGTLPIIRNFKGGVEHCHGSGWSIKDCNNIEHCTYLKIENCYNISHCNIGKGYDEYGRGNVSVINCSNIEDLITTDETMDGWEFENCQFIRDIKASYSFKFTSCDHISNVVSTYSNDSQFVNCKFIRNIQASDCQFENCEHISNVAHNPSPNYGAQYKNCKYVDPYTCVDFLSLDDIGKVQVLTDDGTFSAVDAI